MASSVDQTLFQSKYCKLTEKSIKNQTKTVKLLFSDHLFIELMKIDAIGWFPQIYSKICLLFFMNSISTDISLIFYSIVPLQLSGLRNK